MKIYFLGSGEIAVPVLRSCANSPELELVGVGTQPDRAAGRRGHLVSTPVGAAAAADGFNPDKPENVNAPEFLNRLRKLEPDVVLVVSFGQLLRRELLELPRFGCVNVHASLLPRYRGASPIVQALLNRDASTGVCFMRMERGLDTGAVYRVLERPLRGNEYADTLEAELGELAALHTAETLTGISSGKYLPQIQNESGATFCSKIKKDDAWIDWRKPAAEVAAMVRAYHPWPGARTLARRGGRDTALVLRRVEPVVEIELAPGAVVVPDRRTLLAGCGDCAVRILELTPESSGTMSAASYINGLRGGSVEFLLPERTSEV